MKDNRAFRAALVAAASSAIATSGIAAMAANEDHKPITIVKQGSFFVGGKTVEGPKLFDPTEDVGVTNDQTFWIDQLYAEFQIPSNDRDQPLVLVHGSG